MCFSDIFSWLDPRMHFWLWYHRCCVLFIVFYWEACGVCPVTGGISFDLLIKTVVSALCLYCKSIFPLILILRGEILWDYIPHSTSTHLFWHPPMFLARVNYYCGDCHYGGFRIPSFFLYLLTVFLLSGRTYSSFIHSHHLDS